MSQKVSTYRFLGGEGQFARLYQVIDEVAAELGLSTEDQLRFALCVSEAYTNAYLHGNSRDADKPITIRFTSDQSSLRVDVEDCGNGNGRGIDLAQATPSAPVHCNQGRGLGLMKRYATDLELTEMIEGGLRVTIHWKLQPQAIDGQKSNLATAE